MYCEQTQRDCPIKAAFAKHPELEHRACPHCLKQHENDATIRERILRNKGPQDRSHILV